jgi:hypothetical protein
MIPRENDEPPCVLVGVLSGVLSLHQLLLVFIGQDRRRYRDRQLVDLAGKGEGNLVVLIVDRRAGVGADVERFVPWQDQGYSALHTLRRDGNAVNR